MKVRVPHLIAPVLVATGVMTACSSKAPPADAYVSAQATQNSTNGSCNFAGVTELSGFPIGSDVGDGGAISPNPTRIPNGSNQGGAITIECSVKSTGNGTFDISLYADVFTQQVGAGGSMQVSGSVTTSDTVGATGASQGLYATFGTGGSTYTDSTDCTITFPTIPPGGPVDPGRIWGKIDCPNAVLQNKTLPGGGMEACDISALFVFENCSD